MASHPLTDIRTFPQLVKYLRDELDWPIESEDFDDLTFDYEPDELGLDFKTAAKIQEIKQLRPLATNQPWGIFFVKFEPKQLPVVALRRILGRLVIKKRASANKSELASWQLNDLLFISSYGDGSDRQISLAHFSTDQHLGDLPTLRVLGWDGNDRDLKLDHVVHEMHSKLCWPSDENDSTTWRELWSSAFVLRHREVITTSQRLAVRLADLAADIRRKVNAALAVESDKGPLRKLMHAFRGALIHDLTEDDFADMYAQTIAYGLMSARVARQSGALVAEDVALMVPVTNPFLRELMETFLRLGGRNKQGSNGASIDFDELGISEVVENMRGWEHSGFSVDQSVFLPAGDQAGIERLIQYMTRCPFSLSRLVKVSDTGQIVYQAEKQACRPFPDPKGDGTQAGVKRNFQILPPLDFLAEFTQHIPPKGSHLIRYYGWYSNKSRGMRKKTEVDASDEPLSEETTTSRSSQAWAMLIKRVYEVDPLSCPECGGQMKVVAFIEPPQTDVIEEILQHCGLWHSSSPRAPPDVEGLVLELDAAYSASSIGSPSQADPTQELTFVDIDTFLSSF
jgi:hypothetical protein